MLEIDRRVGFLEPDRKWCSDRAISCIPAQNLHQRRSSVHNAPTHPGFSYRHNRPPTFGGVTFRTARCLSGRAQKRAVEELRQLVERAQSGDLDAFGRLIAAT